MSPQYEKNIEPFPRFVWILGGGRFGRLAAERLTRRFREAAILVVDERSERLVPLAEQFGVKTCAENAMEFLDDHDLDQEVWIVPAIPIHAAFQWLLRRARLAPRAVSIPVPEPVDPQVPNAYRVSDGTVYASYATFLCPDNCSEPEELCTHTREPRRGNLFEELERISVPQYRVAVLRSHQLAPGVGGYTGGQLKTLEKTILEQPGHYLIATSCRCHGVINALYWQ